METLTKRNLRRNSAARGMAAALALATALGGMSTAIARADDRGHAEDRQGQDQRGRQQQHVVRQHVVQQHYAPQHRGYVYERPRDYDRAPPPVDYYQPQPPPAVDFVFPLYLR